MCSNRLADLSNMGGKSKTSGWLRRNGIRALDRAAVREQKQDEKRLSGSWCHSRLVQIFEDAAPVPNSTQSIVIVKKVDMNFALTFSSRNLTKFVSTDPDNII